MKSQVLPKVGVTNLVLGKYVTSGSGKNKTTVFTPTSMFKLGETVVTVGLVFQVGLMLAGMFLLY